MNWPSVSCICITRNRRIFLRKAIDYFWRSRRLYPGDSQLLILDGSSEHFRDWIDWPYVLYLHEPSSVMQAGEAHNRLCELAKGDIILQWDDDDWQHPMRIARQVNTLLQAPGDSFAFTSRYYWYHLQQKQACKAKSWMGGEGSTGATFAYWKETWKKTPFRDIPIGEDVPFQRDLLDRGCPMLDSKEDDLVVYIRHNQNASYLTNYQWNEEDTQAARKVMSADLDFYDGIGELLPVANWNHPNAPGSKVHVMNPLQQVWARHHR
jgi:glycosyl transferase family 2